MRTFSHKEYISILNWIKSNYDILDFTERNPFGDPDQGEF